MENKFTQYIKEELANYLPDIANFGCSGGFPGLTYYKDTVALFEQYKEEIFEILGEMADSQGVSTLELIASFNGREDVDNYTTFANLMVWAAAEEVARNAVDRGAEVKIEENII